MSNLFTGVPAVPGATRNEQFDFCSIPSFLSRETKRGSPVREAQALYARSLARMALQSTALILIIVFSMMTMVKPAQASGTVSAISTYYHVWGPGYILNGSCVGLSSVAAIQSCELAIYSKQSSCAAATLVDDGRIYGSTNAFRIITTPGAITNDLTKGGTLLGNGKMLLCYPPYDRTYTFTFQVVAASNCPAHAQPQWAEIPCTCTDPYKPNQAGTSCVLTPTCTVTTKVADITDAVAKLYDNGTYSTTKPDLVHLTPETQTGLACIQQKVAALNCYMTPRPTSGYRPTAYQTHIREVYDKWQLIKDDNTPACAETKAAIYAEWLNHRPFARRPGFTSNHSQVDAQGNPAGNAVDISYVPDNVNVSADAIACQCNMYRPMINMPDPTKNDPVHYQPRTCPR